MNKRAPIFGGLIILIIALWLQISSNPSIQAFIDRINNMSYDLQLRTQQMHKGLLSPSVVIIDIDDKSLHAEGQWPWSRGKMAELVTALAQEGAVVLAFDIFFSEQEDNIATSLLDKLKQQQLGTLALRTELEHIAPSLNNDAQLAQALAANPNVLAITFLPQATASNVLPKPILPAPYPNNALGLRSTQGFIASIPELQTASKYGGFINIYPDNDGIMRRVPLLMNYHNNLYPSLALQAVSLFLGNAVSLVTEPYGNTMRAEGVKMGQHIITTDNLTQVLIPFVGRSYTFPYYSATEVLHHRLPKDALLGKLVFVGTSATGLGDLQATAIQSPFPGVEIQASIANGLITHQFNVQPAWAPGAKLICSIIFGLAAAIIFPYFGPRFLSCLVILIPLIVFLITTWLWQTKHLFISFFLPTALLITLATFNLIYGYLFESRRRERLKEMFGQYVPEKHIDHMLKNNKTGFALGGESREMSVLFADIRNFTSISENLTAAELVDLLNTFFTPMTEIIFKHRGTIDKYVGDLIMAFWGAPLNDKHHARNAVLAALEMQRKVDEMATLIAARGWPPVHIGIGINSGSMSVGDMGSRFRRNYTVLGDAVNLASRVESLSKYYGAKIIVTENTLTDQNRFTVRKLDVVRVKGKLKGITIYEPLGLTKEIPEKIQQELARYHQGLALYYQQQFDEAENVFVELKKENPDIGIYALYLDRIAEYRITPPPENWDGVYTHITK